MKIRIELEYDNTNDLNTNRIMGEKEEKYIIRISRKITRDVMEKDHQHNEDYNTNNYNHTTKTTIITNRTIVNRIIVSYNKNEYFII